MRKVVPALVLLVALVPLPYGKDKRVKPWTEWSQKDAQNILDDSAWGQTQTESDVSEMFYSPTTGRDAARSVRGATNQAIPMNFRIRLLSAKPIRQAFARVIALQQKSPNPQLEEGLKTFVARQFDQWIVVAVDFDSRDQRYSGQAMQILNSATAGSLKNNTYLETSDGRRIFLDDYKAPISDGLGAKFIFPRTVEGEPFVRADSGELRFYSQISSVFTLNMKFKVADFAYEGVLEY